MTQKIVAVAIRYKGMIISTPAPARHGDVLEAMHRAFGDPGFAEDPINQGFLTDTGRYVERIPAVEIAVKAGQIEKPNWPPNLYSEDLW